MIRVLIADDHTIFRQGLARLFADTSSIQVVDEASTGPEAIGKVRSVEVDVVVLDINLPRKNGLEVLQQIKLEKPRLPVLILSMYPEEQYAIQAFKAGAAGYLTKGHKSHEVIAAIRKVASGGRYATRALAEKLLMHMDGDYSGPAHHSLSAREYEIFNQIVNGKSLTEIGALLSISISTVSTYRRRILEKMHLMTNADLIRYAMTNRLHD